ncbi:hypothetical protein GGQ68_001150 [Sagittula marina]|uniref:PRC-barrel domain-containing protein n=1 Tax=Sagittula marina TaxID=943940 RepID=A0A7W6DLM0_9RHOB|nr:PRC-barrel domain-containing protein [Sagittula marina]MBB3984834.1 hypothetical protein [Sagittula marina]
MTNISIRHLLGTSALVLAGTAGMASAQATDTNDGDACQDLAQLIETSGDNGVSMERLNNVIDQDAEQRCLVVLQDVEEAGGLQAFMSDEDRSSETFAAAEKLDAEVDATRQVSEQETVTETVEIERTAIVEGEVAVAVPQPDVNIEQGNADVTVTSQAPSVDVEQQQPTITVRQPQQIITMDMPAPTITIEQAAPEIIITMPDPTVNVGSMQPQVDVVMADPTVRVEQADPQVALDLNARIVEPDEAERLAADNDGAAPVTTTMSQDEGEPNVTTQVAEAMVKHNEAGEAQVNISRVDPIVNYEGSEPEIRYSMAEQPTVKVNQTGEPKVTFQQANAEGATGNDTEMQQDANGAPMLQEDMDAEQQQAEADPMLSEDEQAADATAQADPALTTDEQVEQAQGDAMTDETMDDSQRAYMSDEENAEASNAGDAMSLTVAELEGMTVYDENGDSIGDIGRVLTNSEGAAERAVIDISGFLGIGARSVAVPLTDLSVEGEGNDMRISAQYTEDQLREMPRYQD